MGLPQVTSEGYYYPLTDPKRSSEHYRAKVRLKLSASEAGYVFEHDQIERLMSRLEGWSTVQFLDAYGNPITAEDIRDRYGAEGGVDVMVLVTAKTKRALSRARNMFEDVLMTEDY